MTSDRRVRVWGTSAHATTVAEARGWWVRSTVMAVTFGEIALA
jgi:hypothetical protein